MIEVVWRDNDDEDKWHRGPLLGFVYKEKHFMTYAIVGTRLGRVFELELDKVRLPVDNEGRP